MFQTLFFLKSHFEIFSLFKITLSKKFSFSRISLISQKFKKTQKHLEFVHLSILTQSFSIFSILELHSGQIFFSVNNIFLIVIYNI